MVTYGGMAKKPVTVSTSQLIFKVSMFFTALIIFFFSCIFLHLRWGVQIPEDQ